jgi:aspartate kinase
MKVLKFGGTSVEDADAMRNVVRIVRHSLDDQSLVVVSACAGVTNTLIGIAKKAVLNEQDEALRELERLILRHKRITGQLLDDRRDESDTLLDRHQYELSRLLKSLAVLKVLPPQTLDQCMAYGEQWSSLLLTQALNENGITAVKIDARDVMITDDQFTQAAPLFEIIRLRAVEIFSPLLQGGNVVVTQGFLGSTKDGVTTTIGRGGSDYSAAIFGAVLGAEEIQIWTDVDGVLSADPNIIPTARRISELSFNEAAELAYFGAKVLHPSTIVPAIEKNIPVRVLNSRRPEYKGTLIISYAGPSTDCIVKSVAYRKGITVITIQSTRMLMGYGFLARVFDIFARHQKSIDVVVTSEVSVSLTIDDSANLDPVVKELESFSTVRVDSDKAILCVVGENMKYTKGIAGRIFNALGRAGINIELISHGGSEINLTFVIGETQIVSAVQALHSELFPV